LLIQNRQLAGLPIDGKRADGTGSLAAEIGDFADGI